MYKDFKFSLSDVLGVHLLLFTMSDVWKYDSSWVSLCACVCYAIILNNAILLGLFWQIVLMVFFVTLLLVVFRERKGKILFVLPSLMTHAMNQRSGWTRLWGRTWGLGLEMWCLCTSVLMSSMENVCTSCP